ncbi:MAG: hypothetical protein QXZ25_04790 [Candidatus Bathyarchaeia archaeon]
MNMTNGTKAISTFILILLVLLSMIIGALLSYMWVLSNFYLEPENTVGVVITEVNFPVNHGDYFNVTVMNPSHSPSDTNITEIYLTIKGDPHLYRVNETDPEKFPIPLQRGSVKTIKCIMNWGKFAGEIITVHVSAFNASGATRSSETKFVKLEAEAYFNAAISCKHFNVTVRNHEKSAINLTLIRFYLDEKPVENMSISLPRIIMVNETLDFQCFVDWQGRENPLVLIETAEGYNCEIKNDVSSTVILQVTDVTFNELNPNELNITIFNSANSATSVDVSNIVLTYYNNTKYNISGSLANPQLPHKLERNTALTFKCIWPWKNYRDKNITVTVYTRQGFMSASKTVKTPPQIVLKIAHINFNLTETEFFLVNIKNMPCSIKEAQIAKVMFNNNESDFEPQTILVGEERLFKCGFNWANFKGERVTITVYTADGLNVSKSLVLPSVDMKILMLDFGKLTNGIPFVNVTILNSAFSRQDVTITQITFNANDSAKIIDGTLTSPTLHPKGYLLSIGAKVTIVCPWNWVIHQGENLMVIVKTAEGFSTSQIFQIPKSIP